jgi:hypothetical protein
MVAVHDHGQAIVETENIVRHINLGRKVVYCDGRHRQQGRYQRNGYGTTGIEE